MSQMWTGPFGWQKARAGQCDDVGMVSMENRKGCFLNIKNLIYFRD